MARRRIWRSWVMLPQHVVHVVEAAWLLVALVFRQEDVCAAAVQVGAWSTVLQPKLGLNGAECLSLSHCDRTRRSPLVCVSVCVLARAGACVSADSAAPRICRAVRA